MKCITYQGTRHEVEIIALSLPREAGLMGRGHSGGGEQANVTLLCREDLRLGSRFILDNAEETNCEVRVVGCSARADGRYVVLGVVEKP